MERKGGRAPNLRLRFGKRAEMFGGGTNVQTDLAPVLLAEKE